MHATSATQYSNAEAKQFATENLFTGDSNARLV